MLSSSSSANKQEVIHKIDELEGWLRQHSFPKGLRNNIRRYYINEWTVARLQEDDLFTNLPSWLRLRAAQHMQRQPMASMLLGEALGAGGADDDQGFVLQGDSDVKGAGNAGGGKAEQRAGDVAASDNRSLEGEKQLLAQLLAEASVPLHVASGRRLYTVGDTASKIYLLDEGQLMTAVGLRVGAKFEAPALVGMSALFAAEVPECRSRLHTVRAVSNCRLWVVDAAYLRHRLAALAPGALLRVLGHFIDVSGGILSRMEALPPETAALPAVHETMAAYESMLRKLGVLHGALQEAEAARAARLAAATSRRAGGGQRQQPGEDLEAQDAGVEEAGDGLGMQELSGRVVLRRRQNSVRLPVDLHVAAQAGMSQTNEGVSYSISCGCAAFLPPFFK